MNRFSRKIFFRSRLRVVPLAAPRYRYVRRRWHVLFAVVDTAGGLLFAGCCAAGALVGRRERRSSEPARILLLQLDHMGDAVITTGMLPHLAARFPAAAIDVLASRASAAVFRASPQVRDVHVVGHTRFEPGGYGRWIFDLAVWAWRLRKHRYEMAIDTRGEFPHALLMWLAGIGHRIGFGAGGGGFLLTESGAYRPGRAEHDSRRELLRAVSGCGSGPVVPHLKPTEQARIDIRARLAESFPVPARYVVLHVGAGTAAKRWPQTHWVALAGTILARCSAGVVLVGGTRERAAGEQIHGRLNDPRLVDWTGVLSFDSLTALLEAAAAVVSADSGPAHLAAAVGTPVVVLFSGTNDARQWRPAGQDVAAVKSQVPCAPCHRSECPFADHACMEELSPAMVWSALAQRLVDDVPAARSPVEEFSHRNTQETAA